LTRVIFDRRLRTPPTARVLSTLGAGPVIIISTKVASADKRETAAALTSAGAQVLECEGGLPEALRALTRYGIMSIVLEGGAELHRAALDADVVDALNVYIAPTLLGPGAVAWIGGGRLSWDALEQRRAAWLGDVVLVEGYVHRTG
jgi:diaminohydroxyphosphoribosylaminopyrimidine deaminase/5-amino-6-(5-phosphoribosylamino)uracil reductase